MWRVFFILLCFLPLLPVRAAAYIRWENGFLGYLCIGVGGVYVYMRHVHFQRPEAGEYTLQFYNRKGKLKNTVMLFPPPKKEQYGRRLMQKQEVGELLYLLFQKRNIRFIRADVVWSGDAALAATLYGISCAVLSTIQAVSDLPIQASVRPDFSDSGTQVQLSCMVCLPLGKLLVSALRACRKEKV